MKSVLLSIAIPVLLAGLLLPAYAQKADIVNSKYLTITEQKFTKGDFSDTITGTIQNASPSEINLPSVYAALYDSNNGLITVASGIASITQLKSGDSSPFDIQLFGSYKDDIDHYTLFASGTPL
ncbi:MAG TPA: FxLYD domain-containing protein [Nitrososphaeraceae archaeon]|nr:FxLYD domain-containing protein [Nitrososphaeraceae archaeon]